MRTEDGLLVEEILNEKCPGHRFQPDFIERYAKILRSLKGLKEGERLHRVSRPNLEKDAPKFQDGLPG